MCAENASGRLRRTWWTPGIWLLAAGGLLFGGISCASRSKKAAGNHASATAAAPLAAPADGDNAEPGGRLISRASVENTEAAGDAPSPGRELVEHALATAGSGNPAGSGTGVPSALAERRVGVVRVIGAHGKFILIETTSGVGDVPLNAGEELRCRGSAANGGVQTAVVNISRERQPPFLVADVISGEPQVGDVAYFAVAPRKETR